MSEVVQNPEYWLLISSLADTSTLRRADLLYSLCWVSYIDTAFSGNGFFFLLLCGFKPCVSFCLNEESHFSHTLTAIETTRSTYYGRDNVQSAIHYCKGDQILYLAVHYPAYYTAIVAIITVQEVICLATRTLLQY